MLFRFSNLKLSAITNFVAGKMSRQDKRSTSNGLAVETLEDRVMLSSVVESGGVVTVRGDATDDLITLYSNGAETAFTVSINSDPALTQTFQNADISKVIVFAAAGDDEIRNTLHVPAEIFGQNGDDFISGGFVDDRIYGGNGADTLRGRSGDDYLNGGDGDDTLLGQDGNDRLFGGNDHDVIDGQDGNDYLNGQSGDDQLRGGEGNDELLGGAGDDDLRANAGDDSLKGGQGADQLFGASGADNLQGSFGDDSLYGGDGDDVLGGGDGEDLIYGDNGDDNILGGNGNDDIRAGSGDDFINGGAGDDRLLGQAGADTARGAAGDDFIDGGGENDSLYGGNGLDTIIAGTGNDTANGGLGNDTIFGIDGANSLSGNVGDDHIYGGSWHDIIAGNQGADVLLGGLGDDTIFGNAGDDLLDGEDGDDTISAGAGNDLVNGGLGDDTIFGVAGNNFLNGDEGIDLIHGGKAVDIIDGGSGDDLLAGNEGADVLNGGLGSDTLFGGPDGDHLIGDEDDDFLYGQDGDDVLDGGQGEDLILGNDGDDSILASFGDDSIRGNSGSDRVFYFADQLDFQVDLLGSNYQVTDLRVSDLPPTEAYGVDQLTDVEELAFGEASDPTVIPITDAAFPRLDSDEVVAQLNEVLPAGWSSRVRVVGGDLWLRTLRPDGTAHLDFRLGSAGVIAEVRDVSSGDNLLAPSFGGELTDRVVQWTVWETGEAVVHDVPSLPEYEDRLNITQAGTFDGVFNGTVDVDVDAEKGQVDVWAVVDRNWKSELDPFIEGTFTSLTRTTVLEGGAILVSRVARVGEISLNGTPVTLEDPYFEAWTPLSDSAFDSLARGIDASGTPSFWYGDGINIPFYDDTPVENTRGWTLSYDRSNIANGDNLGVVFGTEKGTVHHADGSVTTPRRYDLNTFDFVGGVAILPGLYPGSLSEGAIIEQHLILSPGEGINASTPVKLDALAAQLPPPRVYHAGAQLNGEIAEIANRLSTLTTESRAATDSLAELL